MDITRRGLLGLLLALLVSCGSPNVGAPSPSPTTASAAATATPAFPRTVTDFQGRNTVIAKR
ncbi:MAG TPA: hypothetical protein VGA16_00880, partial [Candidatus Limnocylindria bacterium]